MTDLPPLFHELREIVHPATMADVVRVESGGHVFAVNVNRRPGLPPPPALPRPRGLEAAVELAEHWIGRGYTVDMGLGQINSANLPTLRLTVRQVFDPRTNLRAAATILSACYARAIGSGLAAGDPALRGALSCYNTGDMQRGVQNGYVSRYGPVPQATRPIVVQARVSPPRANPRTDFAEAPPQWRDAVGMTLAGGLE